MPSGPTAGSSSSPGSHAVCVFRDPCFPAPPPHPPRRPWSPLPVRTDTAGQLHSPKVVHSCPAPLRPAPRRAGVLSPSLDRGSQSESPHPTTGRRNKGVEASDHRFPCAGSPALGGPLHPGRGPAFPQGSACVLGAPGLSSGDAVGGKCGGSRRAQPRPGPGWCLVHEPCDRSKASTSLTVLLGRRVCPPPPGKGLLVLRPGLGSEAVCDSLVVC